MVDDKLSLTTDLRAAGQTIDSTTTSSSAAVVVGALEAEEEERPPQEGENNLAEPLLQNRVGMSVERSKRRLKLIQAIFLLLGIGVLVSWNAFISAKGYFFSRLCGEAMDQNLESIFSIIYNVFSVASLGSIILVQWAFDKKKKSGTTPTASEERSTLSPSSHANPAVDCAHQEDGENDHESIPTSDHGHTFIMVMVPLVLNLVVFLVQSVMVLVPVISPSVFQALLLASLALSGVCGSVASAGVVATAGRFPPDRAMNPFLEGQSVGGVLVSLANFLAASWEDPSVYMNAVCNQTADTGNSSQTFDGDETCIPYDRLDWAVLFYFLLGSLTLVGCLVGFFHISRINRDYETVDSDAITFEASRTEESLRGGLELPVPSSRDEVDATSRPGALHYEPSQPQELNDHRVESLGSTSHTATAEVWEHIKAPSICIFLVFFVTLSLFPGWTSELRSVHECRTRFRLSNDLYTPFSFLLFNVGDLAGRILSSKLPMGQIHGLSQKLVIGSILRFLFFPLLFLCVGGSHSDRLQIPSDLFSFAVQLAFALTNGLLVSTAFVHAPTLLPNSTGMQERMSEILTFSLASGLLAGSFFSYPVSKLAN